MRVPSPPDRPVPAPERPGVALGVASALFLVWYGASSLAIAWWDTVRERQWAAVSQTQPLIDGTGHWQSGNWRLDLTMGPQPFISQRPVRVVVRLTHAGTIVPGQQLAMRLKMPSMPSFDLAVRLTPQGRGTFTGMLNLPLCTGRATPAVLQVRCDDAGRTLGTGFRFAILPPPGRR